MGREESGFEWEEGMNWKRRGEGLNGKGGEGFEA